MKKLLIQSEIKGSSMFRLIGVSLLFFAATSSASAIVENQVKIDSMVNAIESRKGLDIGGTVRAFFVNSKVSSDQDVNAYNQLPDRETAEFVQLDLDLTFRPWDWVRVNAKLRAFAGMQDYFAASATSITLPWMNIEGNVGNFLHWTVGDFSQQISPLTLFVPGIDIMYEPLIFSRNREMAEGDAMMNGTERNLQGARVQYRDSFGKTVGEIRAEAIFSRLRRAEYLDASGAMGNLLPNEGIDGASQAGSFDKYALIGNLEWYPIQRNLMLGATYSLVWDDEASLERNYFYDPSGNNGAGAFEVFTTNPLDSLPQETHVVSVRAGVDVAGLLDYKNLIANLTGEWAMSNDKVYSNEIDVVTLDSVIVENDDNGMAINVNLNVGYQMDFWMLKASVDFVHNDSSWYNTLAQSSSFIAQRILNSDKDGNLSKYGVHAPLYSSFDALYYFQPRHSPVSSSLSNPSPLADKNGKVQNESYNIAPYSKSSYNTSVLTRKELALVDELTDANLQLALPNGLATANRNGARINAVAGLGKENVVEVQGLFTMMEQVSGLNGLGKASYAEYGVGAKVDVLKLFGFNELLELSGSYKYATREIEDAEFNTEFTNIGFYWRFYKRFGFAAGFQMIRSNLNVAGAELQQNMTSNLDKTVASILKGKQYQWMVGFDYTLMKHAWLSINYGQMTVENAYRTAGLLEDGNKVDSTLPDYLVALPENKGAESLKHKFTRNIIEATINVAF